MRKIAALGLILAVGGNKVPGGQPMFAQIDYNAVSAYAAVAASLIAVVALLAESRRSRFSTGLDAMMKLDDTWSGDRMRQARNAAALALRDGPSDQIDDVLDFFEFLGYLVRRHAVDEFLVWHSYFYWLHRYRTLAAGYIATQQQRYPTVWVDMLALHKKLVGIEKRESGCSDPGLVLSPEDANRFIAEEIGQ
jgi:hypothetical protein